MRAAQALSQTIGAGAGLGIRPEDEFGFADLARDYFNDKATLGNRPPRCSACSRRRTTSAVRARARFKKALAEIVQQALAAIEKKKLVLAQIAEWATALGQGECPQPIREQLLQDPLPPDKNAPEYKAVVGAPRHPDGAAGPAAKAGAIDSAYQFHWQAFPVRPLSQRAPAFRRWRRRRSPTSRHWPAVQAFSIDDSQTTEIDDALGAGLGTGTVVVGIHIAAPASPSSPAVRWTRSRASACPPSTCRATRSPCCPTPWCRPTRLEGRDCPPAVSLYVTLDERP